MMRLLLAAITGLLLPLAASAHAVGLEVKPKGATVLVEAFYDDDTPVSEAKVTVEDGSKAVIAEGTTDAKGNWSFPTPKPGTYWVHSDAGFGHTTKRKFDVLEPPASEVRATEEPAVISEGPSREDFTGRNRVIGAIVGIAIIAGSTGLLWWFSRIRASKKP